MSGYKTLVMKFGGESVKTPLHFAHVSDLIICRLRDYQRIVVVVSAMGHMTDELFTLAHQVHPHPPQRELDMLLTAGERISIALLAMAMHRKGVAAISLTGSQSGIVTSSSHFDALIDSVRPSRVISELEKGKVVIVAGFQGVSREGEITTLGRGGSDTSAVAMGVALKAEKVEFYKDVSGIFSEDPKKNVSAMRLQHLTYKEALAIIEKSGHVLHPRSIALAERNGLPLFVCSFRDSFDGFSQGTQIDERDGKRPEEPSYEMCFN